MSPENIEIESNSLSVYKSFALSGGCYFQASGGIYIGKNSIFAHGVTIVTIEHNLSSVNELGKSGKVIIGENCWLGAKATILSGVTLGNNTIVGANSVVTKSFPEGKVILAGVPAKIIKRL
jgi:acetyltransferase-like isoleucine patch superfamily enzyme